MEPFREQWLEADVLILGAGGAGLRAAIEAHGAGARVLVLSKGDFPGGCITAIAMGAMSAALGTKDSRDSHYEDTLRGGRGLGNPRLVRILADRGPERARDVERYGTQFDKVDGRYDLFPFPGNATPRAILAGDRYKGGFFKGLVREATRLGIEIRPHVTAVDLLLDSGMICGAAALDMDREALLFVRASSVIVATGGAGCLFSLTTNLAGITGDGYALAYRAGACLTDMEFLQTRACMIHPEAMRGIAPPGDGGVTIGGRFYNGRCERYMKKYHPEEAEKVTRAEVARCTQKEIMEGRSSPHGGVYGDYSGVPREQLAKFKAFMETCASIGFDPSWQSYEWAPGAHYFMGGIVIDERCDTGIAGLYAAGEAQGGTMGANRLPGNALTETQVFGAIAGAQAARRALAGKAAVPPPEAVDRVRRRIAGIQNSSGGIDYREVRSSITEAMSRYAGVIRNEDGLRRARGILEDVRCRQLDRMCLAKDSSPHALAGLIETECIVLVAGLILEAALLRTESRGAHNREDHPEEDPAWMRNIVFRRRNGKDEVSIVDAPGR